MVYFTMTAGNAFQSVPEKSGRKEMSRTPLLTFGRTLKTVAGFLIILAGLLGGLWLAWWLGFRGDIVEILHQAKMSLPGWVWLVMKYGLSLAFGVLFIVFFLILGVLVLGGIGRE